MAKKIAVLVKNNPVEGFRMSVGLTLADDEVSVFVMDTKVNPEEEALALNVETLGDLDVKIMSNNPENKFEQMSTDDIAKALPNYDVVIPY